MQWHFVTTPAASGDVNMAFDEALMRRAATGVGFFRVYSWSSPTLSLGRNQRARGLYNLGAAHDSAVGIVRRPTGGRALLHHREITYSVALPARDPGDARQAYDFINGVLLQGLKRLGVDASLATATLALPPGPRPCFDVPAEREIVVGTRKLVGSAQWRHEGALLQHGSVLVRDDQAMIGALMADGPGHTTPRAATLFDALGRDPSIDEAAEALHDALGEAASAAPRAFEPDDVLLGEVDRLAHVYRDDRWTWRR